MRHSDAALLHLTLLSLGRVWGNLRSVSPEFLQPRLRSKTVWTVNTTFVLLQFHFFPTSHMANHPKAVSIHQLVRLPHPPRWQSSICRWFSEQTLLIYLLLYPLPVSLTKVRVSFSIAHCSRPTAVLC